MTINPIAQELIEKYCELYGKDVEEEKSYYLLKVNGDIKRKNYFKYLRNRIKDKEKKQDFTTK